MTKITWRDKPDLTPRSPYYKTVRHSTHYYVHDRETGQIVWYDEDKRHIRRKVKIMDKRRAAGLNPAPRAKGDRPWIDDPDDPENYAYGH